MCGFPDALDSSQHPAASGGFPSGGSSSCSCQISSPRRETHSQPHRETSVATIGSSSSPTSCWRCLSSGVGFISGQEGQVSENGQSSRGPSSPSSLLPGLWLLYSRLSELHSF